MRIYDGLIGNVINIWCVVHKEQILRIQAMNDDSSIPLSVMLRLQCTSVGSGGKGSGCFSGLPTPRKVVDNLGEPGRRRISQSARP